LTAWQSQEIAATPKPDLMTGRRSGDHRQLFTQAFGLADQLLRVRSATTSGANMRRIADKLLVSLEVRLQQLLEFTERSGHWTTHPKYGQNHAERDFRASPCSELSEHPTAAANKEQTTTLRLSRNRLRESAGMSTLTTKTFATSRETAFAGLLVHDSFGTELVRPSMQSYWSTIRMHRDTGGRKL
jgi:hypothetical protein